MTPLEIPLEKNNVHVYDPRTHRIWRVPESALPSDMVCVTHPGMSGDLWIDLDPVLCNIAAQEQEQQVKDWVKFLPMVALTVLGVFVAASACIAASNAFFSGRSIPNLPQEPGMLALLTSAGCIGLFAYFRQRSHPRDSRSHGGHSAPR